MEMEMECCVSVVVGVRAVFAVVLVIACIVIGWIAAWKLVLVHVPLVQELCKTKSKSRISTNKAEAVPRFSRLLHVSRNPHYYTSEGVRTLHHHSLKLAGHLALMMEIKFLKGPTNLTNHFRLKRRI